MRSIRGFLSDKKAFANLVSDPEKFLNKACVELRDGTLSYIIIYDYVPDVKIVLFFSLKSP